MRKDIKALFTSNSVDWATPSRIYKIFMDSHFIDPCPFMSQENGFGKPFKDCRIFINPPFSHTRMVNPHLFCHLVIVLNSYVPVLKYLFHTYIYDK